MTDLTIRVPAIEKLMDYAASGIGAVAGPMLAPWRAGRDGKARVIAARADTEARRFKAESDAESLRIIAAAQAEARQHLLPSDDHVRGTVEIGRDEVFQRIEFQEQKRLANISSVVNQAASELHGKEVPNDDPDPDWTARFFDCVQDVSSEEIRIIWGRILAGEVESPGRTSLRTLETLRNMTKLEADLFQEVSNLVINGEFVFLEERAENTVAVSLANILHLQDCGLVNFESGLRRNFETDEKGAMFLGYNKGMLMFTTKRKNKLSMSMPMARLTSAGIQLYQLVDSSICMGYLQDVSRYASYHGCHLDYLDGIDEVTNSGFLYKTKTRIDPCVTREREADSPPPIEEF